MALQCIKTGAYAKVAGRYLYGDAFTLPAGGDGRSQDYYERVENIIGFEHLLLNIVSSSEESEGNLFHFEADTWDHWFNERAGKPVDGGMIWQPFTSTLIIPPRRWRWLGYDGRPL